MNTSCVKAPLSFCVQYCWVATKIWVPFDDRKHSANALLFYYLKYLFRISWMQICNTSNRVFDTARINDRAFSIKGWQFLSLCRLKYLAISENNLGRGHSWQPQFVANRASTDNCAQKFPIRSCFLACHMYQHCSSHVYQIYNCSKSMLTKWVHFSSPNIGANKTVGEWKIWREVQIHNTLRIRTLVWTMTLTKICKNNMIWRLFPI